MSDKANSSHTHDDRYYTETEVNAKFDDFGLQLGRHNWKLIATYYSTTTNQSSTFTVDDVWQYKFLIITGKYGSDFLSSHFVPSGFAVGHKSFNLYNGATLIGNVYFNSNTSITITQKELSYAPIEVYAVM